MFITKKRHEAELKTRDDLIASADHHMRGEDFDGVDDHPGRVALIMARLRASRLRASKAEADLAKPRAATETEQKLSEALQDLAKLKENYEARGRVITKLNAEIARLTPLAQKHLDKLARDRKRVRGGAKVSVKAAAKKGAR